MKLAVLKSELSHVRVCEVVCYLGVFFKSTRLVYLASLHHANHVAVLHPHSMDASIC